MWRFLLFGVAVGFLLFCFVFFDLLSVVSLRRLTVRWMSGAYLFLVGGRTESREKKGCV